MSTRPRRTAKTGIAGKRDYVRRVDSLQLDWLRRDLATVEDKSAPVVVAMHAATYRYNKFNDKVTAGLSDPAYSAELKACFDGFEEVHYVSGHIHKNLLARVDDRLIEHNIGAVCGSWWRTGSQPLPDAGTGCRAERLYDLHDRRQADAVDLPQHRGRRQAVPRIRHERGWRVITPRRRMWPSSSLTTPSGTTSARRRAATASSSTSGAGNPHGRSA